MTFGFSGSRARPHVGPICFINNLRLLDAAANSAVLLAWSRRHQELPYWCQEPSVALGATVFAPEAGVAFGATVVALGAAVALGATVFALEAGVASGATLTAAGAMVALGAILAASADGRALGATLGVLGAIRGALGVARGMARWAKQTPVSKPSNNPAKITFFIHLPSYEIWITSLHECCQERRSRKH